MATAIEFNNISKQYRLGLVSTKTLSHDLDRWWKMNILHKEDPYLRIGSVNDRSSAADSEYVWALKNIDFKVEQGDVVGIIGKNGAGKSTLLKLLSKITAPTTGSIRAKGRIGALLEVGTGFHPEMTGRENIYLNGAIMGMNKQEISRKLDEIVAFSGCERYIDTPVKRYSSGMTVRLGFAVAAHLDPEILVVDEVLAVGDAEFQKKAIGKMHDVSQGEGRTVLFVSHNMESIQKLCNHSILLDKGTVSDFGNTTSIISKYLKGLSNRNINNLSSRTDRSGNGSLRLAKVSTKDGDGIEVDTISIGEPFTISVIANKCREHLVFPIEQFTIAINNQFGERAIIMNNMFINKKISFNENAKYIEVNFNIRKCPLTAGEYGIAFFCSDAAGNIIDWIDNVHTLSIRPGDYYRNGVIIREDQGKVMIDYEIEQIH